MKLYEVNQSIEAIFEELLDPETGEILNDSETMWQQLEELQMERKRILEYLAKLVLNLRSDQSELKIEEQRLKSRRERIGRKEQRIMQILDRECSGEKTDLCVATVNYRATESVSVMDAERAVKWLKRKKYANAYRVPLPEVAKTEVKKLLKSGIKVPGVELVKGQSCSLK